MYHILETQQNADGTAQVLNYQAETENEAISVWHGVLQYAALSNVFIHSCAVMTEDLKVLKRESYTHYAPIADETLVGGEANGSESEAVNE